MKTLWCWRCKMDIPMLEDDEWKIIMHAHRVSATDPAGAFDLLKREARRRGLPAPRTVPADADLADKRYWHLLAGYEMFTGWRETIFNAVWHHVASQHGPPCPACGKPLRTPKAKLCAACGWGMQPTAVVKADA